MSNKKSLEEIWQKMQSQKAEETQRKLLQEKTLWEQREKARQEYLKRMRMFEARSSAAASSAAAGAGAGGGGSTLSRRNPTQQIFDFEKIIAEHFVISWADIETDTWKIAVFNFSTNQLSDTINTGLIYDSANQWYLDNDEFAVSESGHSIVFINAETAKYKIVFVNSNGQLLSIKDLDNSEDFQYTENAMIFLGELEGVSTVYHFDGANVRTHQFPGVDINDIEVDDGSEDDVTKDGSIIIRDINDEKYYIAKPSGQLIDISDNMIGQNSYRLDYDTDYIIIFDDDSNIKVVSEDGVLKNTFDLTQYNINYEDTSSLYGDNCAYALFYTNSGYRLVVSYDGDSNQFVSFTFSNNFYHSLEADEISWFSPKPYRGKTLNFYRFSNASSGNNIGDLYTDLEYKWLPKGGVQFLSHSFGSATVSLVDGLGNSTSNRIFSLGENPITMFADPEGPIIVGFLTPDGFITQSTGIQYASCSNVWGKPIGENSFAVFDVDWMSDRIWQIYGTNSIIGETTTSQYWAWGTDDDSVHRNGTLLIQDQIGLEEDNPIYSNTFYWTNEIGLTSGPTGLGYGNLPIINSVESGNRTGISTEYQVLTRINDGEFLQGFYLLSRSGLSEFVDCFPGEISDYNLNESKLNSELLTLYFIRDNSDVRIQNYTIPQLELIDDWNPGFDNSNLTVRLFKNRCLIIQEDGDNIDFRFVGKNGSETFSIESNDYNTESNDTYDNNPG